MADHPYQNPDQRCSYRAVGESYCWSYAKHIDEESAFMLAICKYCDMWRPGERVNGGGNENTH